MLKKISVDTVRRAADLASDAAADRERYLAGMYNIELEEQRRERGSRNPTDLDALNIMSDGASAALDELQSMLAGLSAEERTELRAVMLVGRGDYAGKEWDDALAEAGRPPDASDYRDIVEKVDLHAYLTKGLYELKLAGNGGGGGGR
ncbi:DUF3775 domain-containing protein [Azospirillum halopraeferens]|uniref:DUF3775 domain-containing protein n=1 Tax=Azospirillum halopraeferens TaxID=34010 RepID=UPI0004148FEE|nr:DUF3775 domain-containing protein [Azospirillum halopraeferens]